jgi:CRISPR type III-B/RAMP module-associated protein Cmr5
MVLALELVKQIAEDKEVRDDYGRACHSFPPLVRTAGLCQAVAFYKSRASDKHPGFARYLEHMARQLHAAGMLQQAERDSLRNESRDAELTRYMLLTREALACALWHKRLAQSELEVDATEGKP